MKDVIILFVAVVVFGFLGVIIQRALFGQTDPSISMLIGVGAAFLLNDLL